jgi:hypothetical protein
LFVHVRAAASATLIDLAIEPANISVLGEAVGDNLGTWLAIGDVNGDGLEDLLAVACNSHPLGGTRTGTLYILWGDQIGRQSIIDLPLNPPGVSRIFGQPGDDDLLCSVTSGDFNHDGYDDIVWGHALSGAQYSSTGKAYIIFGRPTFPDTLDLYSQPPGVVTIYGDIENGTVGRTLCGCDVDGDGYEDVVLSAPWLEYSEIFIILGRDSFPSTFHTGLSEPGMIRIIDDTPNANMQGMACADVNGDGCDDLALGAIQAERLVMIDGSPAFSTLDSISLADPPVPVKVVLGEYSHGALGIGVAFGDLNDDARVDLVAGAYMADPTGCYDCGEVYVLYDAGALPDTVDLATTAVAMTRVVGFGSSTKYGFRVLCADLSGDAIDDLVVTNRPLQVRSTSSVILGRQVMPATILLATEAGPIARIKAATTGDLLGNGVAAIDLDSDGTRDLVLGASSASPPGRSNAGIAYGFFGTRLVTTVGENRLPRFRVENFPNPFSGRTTVTFGGIRRGTAEVSVFDVAGRQVLGRSFAGHRGGDLEFVWDGRDERGQELPSGVYFCRVRAGDRTLTRKITLVR